MKLISLYIENFGCLHRYDLKFGEGLTVIREDNGFGKTTLAEFIWAMFYGFPRAAKTLDRNKRKKYLPWGGGKCGGHLTFEHDGAVYRVERTFGATPRGDSFALIDLTTNRKSNRFTEEIGVELFQLDADSFERSTYMPQVHETGPLTTDSIRAKLGNLVEDTNDINNFDKAVKALREKRSGFIPYRGSGGSVAEARAQVSRYQEELDRMEGKRDALESCRKEIQNLEERLEGGRRELEEVRERISRASQAAADRTLRRQYNDLQTQLANAREAVGDGTRFASGVPSAESFDRAEEACRQYLTLTAQQQSAGLPGADREQLQKLESFFAAGIPEEEKLDALSARHREALRLRTVAESQELPAREKRELEELERYFGNGIPDDMTIAQAAAQLEQANRLRQENQRLAAAQPHSPAGKNPAAMIICLILGALGLAAGIWLLSVRNVVPGAAALVIGLGALAAGVYLGIRRMISRELSAAADAQRLRMDAAAREAARLEEQVRFFTERYSTMDPLSGALQAIRDRRAAYLMLLDRQAGLSRSRGRTEEELERCIHALQRELTVYGYDIRDAEQALMDLRMKRSRLMELRAKQTAALERECKLQQQTNMLSRQLTAFLSPYYDTVDSFHSQLTRLRRECDEYIREKERLEELKAQISVFRAEHPVLPDAVENADDPEELKRLEKELSDEITLWTRQSLERKQLAAQLREDIDCIPRIRDALEYWQMKKDGDAEKSAALDRTLEYLQQAKDNLTGSYLGTIQKRFAAYLSRLTGEERDKILVTGDLEVRLERQGAARELAFFSAGQSDLVMLCMRFALVDALFADVKPFVILDDPFVNLDDERTAQALALRKDLAKDRQILYLVCNSSRV